MTGLSILSLFILGFNYTEVVPMGLTELAKRKENEASNLFCSRISSREEYLLLLKFLRKR